jgi:hypothetical protein
MIHGFLGVPIIKLEVPASVEEITEHHFCDCQQLTFVNFRRDSHLLKIAGFAQTVMKSIDFPNSVIEIHGFDDCSNLAEVNFGLESHLMVINGL